MKVLAVSTPAFYIVSVTAFVIMTVCTVVVLNRKIESLTDCVILQSERMDMLYQQIKELRKSK